MEGFGTRVLELREQRGWTRRELARRAGLHENHLRKVEMGERMRIEGETIFKLCRALGVSADYLLGLIGTTDAAGVPPDHAHQDAAVVGAST
jgi:transcriptional regulator with XRE-family HTH domain